MQGDAVHCLAECFLQGLDAGADLAGSRQKHEQVTVRLPQRCPDRGSDARRNRPLRVVDIALLHGMGFAARRDYRCVAEQRGDGAVVQGGGHDEQFQIFAQS